MKIAVVSVLIKFFQSTTFLQLENLMILHIFAESLSPGLHLLMGLSTVLAVKDSRCTQSAILNLTALERWVSKLDRKNTSAGILHTSARF